MKARGYRPWSIWRLAGLLLVLGVALGAQAEPPSTKLPGRNPDSNEPWGAFLGRAAHRVIGRQYGFEHPSHRVFLDPFEIYEIVEEGRLGDPKRLSEFVRRLRPDITDTKDRVLFEIKPDSEQARKQGREQAGRYLAALNAVVDATGKKFSGGTGFEGSLFVEFENGGALWRLSWRTPEPGVMLYRWSYRRKKPNTSWQERADRAEEQIPREEMEKHGEEVEQALQAAYGQGTWPSGFQGQIHLPVDCH
jgi:hypothetical protein